MVAPLLARAERVVIPVATPEFAIVVPTAIPLPVTTIPGAKPMVGSVPGETFRVTVDEPVGVAAFTLP